MLTELGGPNKWPKPADEWVRYMWTLPKIKQVIFYFFCTAMHGPARTLEISGCAARVRIAIDKQNNILQYNSQL